MLANNLSFFCPLAIEVMHRVIERLGVQIWIVGFDNESDMINNLAAMPRSPIQTCFAHGAGEKFNLMIIQSDIISNCSKFNVHVL